jgi:hypothetical protein
MDQLLTRRGLVAAGLALPLLTLPGCASTLGGLGGFGLEDAIRRILTISSQRAFTRLLTDEGFFQDEVARVSLPEQLGGSRTTGAIAAILGTGLGQDRLLRLVNRAAREGAEAAAPVVYDSIKTMSISDAVSIVRGGPNAATEYLQRSIGNAIVTAMFPGIGNALRLADNGIVNRVLGAATGINFSGLQQHVASRAAEGIYRAIGREEAAIRANPRSTGDPVLIGAFGILR